MEAIIMAGGEGSRLRPLTCDIPKPMAQLCGKPILDYILDQVQRHGFEKATLTLGYLPHLIREHFPEERHGTLSLAFVEESTPLGTAGGVKNAAKHLHDDFLVMSGDALCDFNLRQMAEYHKRTRAMITIAVTKVDDPREYGLVNFDEDHRVLGFNEKPSWSGVTTCWANTGIYMIHPSVLSMIPDHEPFDFAMHLFPKMLSEEMNIQVFKANGYWCDIGDLESYRRCQGDLLDGKIQGIAFREWKTGCYGFQPKSMQKVTCIPPVYLGEGVKIGENAIIGPHAIVGDNVEIGDYAKIRSSVVLSGCLIQDAARITGGVLCHGVGIGEHASVYENSVMGSGVVVGNHVEIMPDVAVWPNKRVEDGVVLRENVRIGDSKREYFDDSGIKGPVGLDITPEFCARLGSAVGSMKQINKVGVGYSDTPVGKAFYHGLLSGLCGSGTQVWDFGNITLAQMHFVAASCGMQICLYVNGEDPCTISILEKDGLPASRATEREIEKILQKGEFVRSSGKQYQGVADVNGFEMLYQQELNRLAVDGLVGIHAELSSKHRMAERLWIDTFVHMGGSLGNGVKFHLSEDGCKLTAIDENHQPISYDLLLTIGCQIAFEQGQDVVLSHDAPYTIHTLAKQYGRRCYRPIHLQGKQEAELREIAHNQHWKQDGIMLSLVIMNKMKQQQCSLARLVADIPSFARKSVDIPLCQSPSLVMERLQKIGQTTEQGLQVKTGDTVVRVWPNKRGNRLRILAEAYNAETAEELCKDWEGKIAYLLDRNGEM